MKRMLVSIAASWFLLSTVSLAEDLGEVSLTRSKPNTQTRNAGFSGLGSMFSREEVNKDPGFFRFPTPTKLMDGMEKGTDAVFSRTRDSWDGMKQFGKKLNPFSESNAKPTSRKKETGSFFSLFSRKQETSPPATIGEFMQMPRPKF